jgi:hypothetical protein
MLQCKYTTRYYANFLKKHARKSQIFWKDTWIFLFIIIIIKFVGLDLNTWAGLSQVGLGRQAA